MFIVLPPCLPRCTATRLSGMQQQEITRRVEFLFESAAGQGLPIDNTPQCYRVKGTMVRPIRHSRQTARNPAGCVSMAGGGERADAASIIVVPLATKGDASDGGPEVLAASRGSSSSNSVSG